MDGSEFPSMKNTLLLNAGFEPLRVVSWQRAFVLVFQNKVEILEEYSSAIRTVNTQFKIPAVIRLRRWVNLKRNAPVIRFSRANVYARDDFRCQYCYQRFSERELTLDHVKPVVRGEEDLGEYCRCLYAMQPAEKRSHSRRGGVQAPTNAASSSLAAGCGGFHPD